MKTKIKYGIVIGTGIIIFGILGVQAASVVPSNGVLYSNSNSTVTTVEGALNELYAGVERLKSIGTATSSDILSGKTALIKGNEVTGTMPNYSSSQLWINGDNGTFYDNITYTYSSGTTTNEMVGFKSNKAGYFGTNTVWMFGKKSDLAPQIASGQTLLGVTGTYTSDANATASQILSGKTAYVNGKLVTGTIASLAAKTYTPSTSNQTIASGQYLSGAQTIAGDADLISANIKSGANIFGVAGNANVVDTSSGDATAAQILSGKKAYVDGKLVTGTIASLAAKTYTPSTSNQTIAAGKYLSGTQTIKGDADLTAANIKSGVEIFGVTGTAKLVTTLKSWTPNYGDWVNASSMQTTDTYTVSATKLYVLVRAENGGSVGQVSSPICSDGTITLLINNGNGLLYQVDKTASATIKLGLQITRNYSSYPNSTLKVYAIPY